ncbi:MAG: ABC transporter permease [Chloroflexi bacterium]|nr:ABC transporter permease [Chloroflexota bacterium]
MIRQILNLTWKEILQIRRDHFLLLFLILAPSLQLILISQNTAKGLHELPVAVLDFDQSSLSRELITAIDNTQEMHTLLFPASRQELNALIDAGEANIGIVIPPDFHRQFFGNQPEPAQIQVLSDGSNILIGSNAGPVIQGVVGQLSKRYFVSLIPIDFGGVQIETSALFNPTLNFQWFAIPSTLAFITYQVVLVIAATGFVREKELGTLEQLMITPLRRLELILGKAVPAIILGIFNFNVLMFVQTYIYHIPIRGDYLLLLGVAIIFVIAIVGEGTVISVLTQSQQQAVLLVFLFTILEVTISGYLVPIENMPAIMRGLAEVSALQHFMSTMHAIALRDASFRNILPHVSAIAAFAVVTNLIAWRSFTRVV